MNAQPQLKRSLSLTLMVFYGLGTILGAGIYVLVGKVAGHGGLFAPIAFMVAAVVATFTGLSYAELATRFPRSAGAALYVQQGLGRVWLSVLAGFLIILTGIVSAATLANGFVGYLQVFTALPDGLIITVLILGLGLIAAWGISESVMVAAVITVVEIAGLLLILGVAGESLSSLPQRLPSLLPPLELQAWQGILLGAFLAFYAFIGFEDMVNVAEEVKDPQRTLPRAILISLGLATLLYILVALIAVLALPLNELTQTRVPLALIYERATGGAPWLISLISLLAVVNGTLIQIIMGSRLLYGMSREGWLPAAFGQVHARTRTPLLATAVVTAAVLILALWLPLVTLAKATSYIILVLFALIQFALWRIKRRAPGGYPLWVPVAGFFTTLSLVVVQTVALLSK